MNEKRKNRCPTCECYDCDYEECTCDCHEKQDEPDVQGVPV